MSIAKKNISLIILVGLLFYALAVIMIAVCAFNCSANAIGFDLLKDANCALSHQSFVPNAMELSVLFVLPFAGIFVFKGRQFLPAGMLFSLFRPPRIFF